MTGIERKDCPVVLQTGFRIFFLGAAVYAVLGMAFWYLFYVAGANIFVGMPLTVWHGHEMVLGFTMAVVAGFLLTAVMNWTGLPTLHGYPLLALFLLWVCGRIAAFMPAAVPSWPLITLNLIFLFYLTVAVMSPIVAVKQWKQSAVFSKLILLFITACVFYAALIHTDLLVERKALRFAVYMIISLIFTIARRVVPFFIERGVGYPVTLKNSRTLDMISLTALLAFSVLDVFWPQPQVIISLCVITVVAHALRLAGWNTPGVWKKPLLWVLFAGYAFLILGFAFKALAVSGHQSDDAALHAWTAGGIGIFTLGMMARVSWGHTGRNIGDPPRWITVMFLAVILSAVIRVFFPIVFQPNHILWIAISQLFWMLGFGLYLLLYFPVLTGPRFDGKWG